MILDEFLPTYQFSETHACTIAAAPGAVVGAVASYRVESDPVIRWALAVREAPGRWWGRGEKAAKAFGLDDFTVLARTETALVYGLVGRFWALDFGLRPIADAAAFAAFREAGVAKLVLGFETEEAGEGRTRLVTQTRVLCPDEAARRSFLPYWVLIRPVSGLIRRRMLAAIKRHAS
ncbi:hypothetical protein [Pararhodospirillum photometricum]|uniref:DUF2867 domain-containing protein n=1 Tax=Pararhodospirillum photometricum DSM 122 TaxID=1150469 RepID=H6SMK0_PARPM|nr:hypothetical protein [Pararhodospirillum photometricum]CCG09135.1 Putative uncharacterized protein [Pararhodospirillum photometricum DSM 122]